jgi:hypothetical protein
MKKMSAFAALLSALPCLLLAQGERTTVRTLVFLLSPSKEVPAVTSSSKGSGEIEIIARRDANNNILSARVDFRLDYFLGQAESFTGLHIHRNVEGANGAVVVNSGLRGPLPAAAGNGSLFFQVEVTEADGLATLAAIMANPAGFYCNIHTQTNPGGLMRGQLGDAAADAGLVNARVDALASQVTQTRTVADQAVSLLRQIAFRLGIALQ